MSPIPSEPKFMIRRPMLSILLLAAVLRLFLCVQLPCISRDGVQFVTFARDLAVDPVSALRATTKQPGMSLLMLAADRLIFSTFYREHPLVWQACGQLLSFLGGVAVCCLVCLLTLRLFGSSAAQIAGILAALWPQGAHLSADVLSDMPHLGLYLCAILLGYNAIQKGRIPHLALCGFIAGLAYLLRQEALGAVCAVAFCWVFPAGGRRLRRRLMGVVALALAFALPVAPYAVAAGRVMPNKSFRDLLFGSPVVEDDDASPEAPASAGEVPVIEPRPPSLAHVIPWWQAPARMAEEWAKSGRYVLSTLVLLALFLKSAPRAEPTGRRLVVIAILLHLVAVQLRVKAFGEISSRYLVIPAALTIPWAAAGAITILTVVAARLRASADDLRSTFVVWLVGSLIIVLPLLYYTTRPADESKRHYRQAGDWLRKHASPADRILAHDRLEQLMFYAARSPRASTWLRQTGAPSLDSLREDIERLQPDWFVEVRAGRDGPSEAPEYFRALEEAVVPSMQLAWVVGPPERKIIILHRLDRLEER